MITTFINPSEFNPLKTFVFTDEETCKLGNKNKDKKNWDEKTKKKLRKKINLNTLTSFKTLPEVSEVFGGDDIFKEMEEALEKPKTVTLSKQEFVPMEKGIEFVNYPIKDADGLFELWNAISYVSGVPIYALSLFYIDESGFNFFHKVYIKGELQNLDIKKWWKNNNLIRGFPVSIEFDQFHEDVRIVSLETLRLYEIFPKNRYLYAMDLRELINQIPSQSITALINDSHQRKMIYRGFISIFFPQLPEKGFEVLLKREDSLLDVYPNIHPSKKVLKNIKLWREKIFNSSSTKQHKEAVVTDIEYRSENYNLFIDLRNLFDYISLGKYKKSTIIASSLKFYPSIGEPLSYGKKYTFAVGEQNINQINSFFENTPKQPKVRFLVKSINPEYIIFEINDNGRIMITSKWLETDRIKIQESKKLLIQSIKFLFDEIKDNKDKIFPYGGDISFDIEPKWRFSTIHYFNINPSTNLMKEIDKILDEGINTKMLFPREHPQSTISAFTIFWGMNLKPNIDISNLNEFQHLLSSSSDLAWRRTFYGRSGSLVMRSNDVKMEIGFVNEIEISFIVELLSKITKVASINLPKKQETNTQKRLRRLQERDPLLFSSEFLKQGYSILCQGERQPEILTKEELDQNKKKAVKFWNYTEDKEMYYVCPSPKFPYLGFRPKMHKKGLCLPCCRQKPILPNSRNYEDYKKCMEEVGNIVEDIEKPKYIYDSIHILNYGRELKFGRIGYPPPILEELLPKTKEKFYLKGCEQNSTVVPLYGYFSSIATALEFTIDDLLQFINEILEDESFNLEETYKYLGNGIAEEFRDSKSLLKAFYLSFGNENAFNEFSIGGKISYKWILILKELIEMGLEISIVRLIVEDDDINMDLTKNNLYDKIIILVQTQYGIYPLINNDMMIFEEDDDLYKAIKSILKNYGEEEHIGEKLSKEAIKTAEKLDMELEFKQALQNGEIYALIFKYKKSEKRVIFNVPNHPLTDDSPVKFGAISIRRKYPAKDFYNFIKNMNKEFLEMIKKVRLSMLHGKCIGFSIPNLYFFHDPEDKNKVLEMIPSKVDDEIIFTEDPAKINIAIDMAGERAEMPLSPSKQEKKEKIIWDLYSYPMLIAFLGNFFKKEKNEEMRKLVKQSIMIKPTYKAINQIEQILEDESDKMIIIQLLRNHNWKEVKKLIDKISFSFDSFTLKKLRKIAKNLNEESFQKIKKFIKKHVHIVKVKSSFNHKKMYLTQKELEEYSILFTYDLANNIIPDSFFLQYPSLLNLHKFIKRKNELLFVI